MRIRLTQIMTSVMAAVVMVSNGGCPGVWSDTGMPLVIREKIELPVPVNGLKYPLTTPTSEEEKGVLLRCKPQPRKFKYNSQLIMYTNVVNEKGYKQTQKSSEIVRFLPAPDGTNLIRESETQFGLVGGHRQRLLMSPRGGCLKNLGVKLTGFGGMTTRLLAGDQFSSFESEASDQFPKEAVRIGQTWTQDSHQQAQYSYQASLILWRLSGFAEVNGRRCAVLQGTDVGITGTIVKPDFTSKTISSRITVLYFDYERGLDVECITWGPMEKTSRREITVPSEDDLSKPVTFHTDEEESTNVMFWQTSLVE
jgi:hypothetical protein